MYENVARLCRCYSGLLIELTTTLTGDLTGDSQVNHASTRLEPLLYLESPAPQHPKISIGLKSGEVL